MTGYFAGVQDKLNINQITYPATKKMALVPFGLIVRG